MKPTTLTFTLEEAHMNVKKTTDDCGTCIGGQVAEDAADRFVRYGIAGLQAQSGLEQRDAARVLLRAVKRWWGIDFEAEVEALGEED